MLVEESLNGHSASQYQTQPEPLSEYVAHGRAPASKEIATTLDVELLRSSIPSTLEHDVILEESVSKEYDTIEKARALRSKLDCRDQFSSIVSAGTAARGLLSVDRTLDSVGYEAVDPMHPPDQRLADIGKIE